MNKSTRSVWIGLGYFVLAGLVFLWPQLSSRLNAVSSVSAAQNCTVLTAPKSLPSPALINFDTLPNGAVIGASYQPTFGVSFDDNKATRALIYANAQGKSSPNVAVNDAVVGTTSANVPMTIRFDTAKTDVGFWIGNGTGQLTAVVTAYGVTGGILCQTRLIGFPAAHTTFSGFSVPQAMITQVTVDYGDTLVSESIDDLYFSPVAGPQPTRAPLPAYTPVPRPSPTAGPAPTATVVVPMVSYLPVKIFYQVPIIVPPDFSIYGIEVTQGIQCFDTSTGLTSCGNNTLPVVAKKDTTARIYLHAANATSVYNSVPVRLHIRANGVWYVVNSSGKTVTTLNQLTNDSANIWFNVNFSSDVPVDFYAEVDPDNLYSETNEANNRYPAGTGYLTMTFYSRKTMTIVGDRLHIGSNYAGGWAVNGGGADWYEQVLPIRNNGINYTLRSGYLDWANNLGSGDGQHSLIQTLNAQWMLENAFAFWFAGDFTGARHVYGWAPAANYSGGHADMPFYPHAGGLGVVGIGSDAPGTNTDNPGPGALIFGHELTHDYDVYHTNTSDACGSNDSNSDFPYTSSSIQEVGYNPVTGKIYDPALTHDLMSYCPSGGSKQGWISPFTWTAMFGNIAAAPVPVVLNPKFAPSNTLFKTAAGEKLQVNAIIYNPANTPPVQGKLGPLYRSQGILDFLPKKDPTTNYSVELRNSSNAALATYPFKVSFKSEYDGHGGPPGNGSAGNPPPPFPSTPTKDIGVSFLVPWDPGTVSVALLDPSKVVIAQIFVSPNVPQVYITNPSGEESWLAGSSHTLTWQGLDLDGDPLTYAVFYSNDAGVSWVLLANELTKTSYDVITDSMAGGSDVRFRVVVTDGINTSQDETDQSIGIPNKAPMATILSPRAKDTFVPGGLVVLEGTGQDLEDGTLPDGSLSWSSNRQGGLGTGPSLGLNVLQPGWHTLTLTAADSLGVKSTATVQVFIGYQVFSPGILK